MMYDFLLLGWGDGGGGCGCSTCKPLAAENEMVYSTRLLSVVALR